MLTDGDTILASERPTRALETSRAASAFHTCIPPIPEAHDPNPSMRNAFDEVKYQISLGAARCFAEEARALSIANKMIMHLLLTPEKRWI